MWEYFCLIRATASSDFPFYLVARAWFCAEMPTMKNFFPASGATVFLLLWRSSSCVSWMKEGGI